MKIGMFNSCYIHGAGGGETLTADTALALQNLGYEVTIVAGKSYFMKPRLPMPAGRVPINCVPSFFEFRELSRILPGKLGSLMGKLHNDFWRFNISSRISDWDIIHIQSFDSLEAVIRNRDKHQGVVITLLAVPDRKWTQLLMQCDCVTCHFAPDLGVLRNELGLTNVVYVPQCLDLDRFTKLDKGRAREKLGIRGAPVVLSVGRLIQIKNLETLLVAFKDVMDQYHEASLYIIGQGVLRKKLERLSQELGINNNTIFIGWVGRDDLPVYYSAADVFVFPSLADFGPYVPLEALASGCKVVVSDRALSIIEKFPEVKVAQVSYPRDFSYKIVQALLEKTSTVSHDKFQEFSPLNVGNRFAQIYEQIYQRRKQINIIKQLL